MSIFLICLLNSVEVYSVLIGSYLDILELSSGFSLAWYKVRLMGETERVLSVD